MFSSISHILTQNLHFLIPPIQKCKIYFSSESRIYKSRFCFFRF
ncbi:hypothetical protein [Helicobacter sp. 'CLO3_human']|nr:hypothetical protein [Helicobacter sp. 'CLO3_human']